MDWYKIGTTLSKFISILTFISYHFYPFSWKNLRGNQEYPGVYNQKKTDKINNFSINHTGQEQKNNKEKQIIEKLRQLIE